MDLGKRNNGLVKREYVWVQREYVLGRVKLWIGYSG